MTHRISHFSPSPSVPQRNPTPVAVEKRLRLHHVPQRDPKLPGAEKGPKTQVPPAGFLRPGIRRHKGPAGRGPRWQGQGQGLSRRRNALRPPRADRGPPGARVASLSGQAPYTWGPGLGGSVSARGDPRTLPGRAPVPRSTKPTRLCKPETQVLSVIAGGSGTEKFPAAFLQVSVSQTSGATGSGERRADPRAALPARGGQGSRPSPAFPLRPAGAPRGRPRPGGPRPAPHLEPQTGPRPRPPSPPSAPATGSARSAAGPQAAGRPSPSCSPPARRAGGGAAAIYIKGEPALSAGPQRPRPRDWPRP